MVELKSYSIFENDFVLLLRTFVYQLLLQSFYVEKKNNSSLLVYIPDTNKYTLFIIIHEYILFKLHMYSKIFTSIFKL